MLAYILARKAGNRPFFVVAWTELSALIKIAELMIVSLSKERDMYIKYI